MSQTRPILGTFSHFANSVVASMANWGRSHEDVSREALQENQERLNLALEASGAVTWTWSADTGEIYLEGNLRAIFGKNQRSWRSDIETVMKAVHPDDRLMLRAKLESAFVKGGEFEIEHRIVHDDGAVRYIAMRGARSKNDPSRMTGISWDVTDKHAQEVLRRERSEYEASNKAKSVFLANASHEIRTPLAAINGFADMLLQNPELPDEARGDLQMILRNGKYLVSLVNDLLDLSKIESGQIYIQRNVISVIDEIEDIIALIKPMVQGKGLKFEIEFNTLLPEQIESDLTRFREILINLLTNAAKFTEKGLIKMAIGFEVVDSEHGLLKINISDTGIGIPPEQVRLLFRPFVRGENQFVQRVQGSGLGLALSRNLARLLGGDLKLVRSTENEGSEFELTIATGAISENEMIQPSPMGDLSTPVVATEKNRKLHGRHILVVDDSKDLQILMKRFLEKQGARVETSENGQEALDRIAARQTFDVILMDIKMPVMDGYTTTSRLRHIGYSKPIVAITAHASTDDRQRCYQAGFDSYVSKPVDFNSLVKDLQQV